MILIRSLAFNALTYTTFLIIAILGSPFLVSPARHSASRSSGRGRTSG